MHMPLLPQDTADGAHECCNCRPATCTLLLAAPGKLQRCTVPSAWPDKNALLSGLDTRHVT
jgi:hypothetical protein